MLETESVELEQVLVNAKRLEEVLVNVVYEEVRQVTCVERKFFRLSSSPLRPLSVSSPVWV